MPRATQISSYLVVVVVVVVCTRVCVCVLHPMWKKCFWELVLLFHGRFEDPTQVAKHTHLPSEPSRWPQEAVSGF